MGKITKGNLVILAVLLVRATLNPAPLINRRQTGQQKVANPYDKAAVSIDASIVEVNLHSAEPLVMTPRGPKGESVSMEKLQAQSVREPRKLRRAQNWPHKILKTAKVSCYQQIKVGSATSYQVYNAGMEFAVQPFVSSDGVITLSYKFEQSGFDRVSQTDSLPNTSARKLEGEIRLDSGKPIIAGSAQNGDEAYFLVISATIENK